MRKCVNYVDRAERRHFRRLLAEVVEDGACGEHVLRLHTRTGGSSPLLHRLGGQLGI